MPRTSLLLFPNRETEFWLTEQVFAMGDHITRDGQTWIVTSVSNFNSDGKGADGHAASRDESQS